MCSAPDPARHHGPGAHVTVPRAIAPRTRVMLVDDSMVVRRLLRDALTHAGGIDVVATASTGASALGQIPEVKPDVVLLDVEMPGMDGLETLERLRTRWPSLPVIMVSNLTARGAAATARAWELGASDVFAKPSQALSRQAALADVTQCLGPRVRAFGGRRAPSRAAADRALRAVPAPPRPVAPVAVDGPSPEVVVIGVSTGGPVALSELVPHLPADLPVPVLVVQHMPAFFTRGFAERLDAKSAVRVVESEDGMRVEPGTVVIAAGGTHTRVERRGDAWVLRHDDSAPENSCRPSVDVLFRSAAEAWGGRCLAVMLTGMGHDGLEGTRLLRSGGARVVAQDEASSVVWGMPGAVVASGLADHVLPLEQIAGAITELVTRPRALAPRRTPEPAVALAV